MSPQSRAPVSEITTSCPAPSSGSACSSNVSISWDASESSAVHTILDSSSGDTSVMGSVLGKRGSELISSTESATTVTSSQPFLSSYGSAFLSGIFADIAEAQDEDVSNGNPQDSSSFERLAKKSRPSNPAFHPKKSFMALNKMEGDMSPVSSPSVISPRSQKSSMKIELFNDQVRELQNLAFPSLPGLPAAVSSSSCTTATSGAVVTPRDGESDQDQDSFGWFVATDDDGVSSVDDAPSPMFLPLAKPDLAFRVPTAAAPMKENFDMEVQQALAADTIDDVLGDLF